MFFSIRSNSSVLYIYEPGAFIYLELESRVKWGWQKNNKYAYFQKSNYIFTSFQAALFSLSLSCGSTEFKANEKQWTECYNKRHCINQINQDKSVGKV